MTDLWSFLLQSLTASAAAALLLLLKALFRDKLPPSWQFSVWGVLGLVLLLPAGLGGRYVFYNWRYPLELLKLSLGDYSPIRVRFPFPWVTELPRSLPQWLFALYALGVAAHLLWYLAALLRLRLALSRGRPAPRELRARVEALSAELGIRPCRVIQAPGLPSAFVCGLLRPVLAVPAGQSPDDTILLHELLHLRSRDNLWTLLICLLRSLHWCNPLLVYCAGKVGADLESRCDQRVLERLAGEERQDYGRVLLTMANESFARCPGASCFHNGARQLRPRIEAIARFKRYPAGMGLAAGCVLVLLTAYLTLGVRAEALPMSVTAPPLARLAQARSVQCGTPDGALDLYGKALLTQDGWLRVLCAPQAEQEALGRLLLEGGPDWTGGLAELPNQGFGYRVCDLRQEADGSRSGLMLLWLGPGPASPEDPETLTCTRVAAQRIRFWREAGRWVVSSLEAFRITELPAVDNAPVRGDQLGLLPELKGTLYTGAGGGFRVELRQWTVLSLISHGQEDTVTIPGYGFDLRPCPNGRFDYAVLGQTLCVRRLGPEEDWQEITDFGYSYCAGSGSVPAPDPNSVFSGTDLSAGSRETLPGGWQEPYIAVNTSWSLYEADLDLADLPVAPEAYRIDLYVNGEKAASLTLLPEGGQP